MTCLTLLTGAKPVGAAQAPSTQDGGTANLGAGIAFVMGGAMQDDNQAVWQRLVDLAGGQGARFVVLTSASEQPEHSAAFIIANLRRHGARAEFIPVAPLLKSSDYRLAARDPTLVAKVRAARGVYFGGGAQERHMQALYDDAGAATPILQAIWEVYRAGGVVAGSSAGAAIMSSTMFRDAPDLLGALKFGLTEGPGQQIDRGMGFVGDRVVVDQHFLKRGRLARLLPIMVQKGYQLGVGVDENTAAIFQNGSLEVIGASGVLVADLSAASVEMHGPMLKLSGARLSYLERGDRYDLQRHTATPDPGKAQGVTLNPNAANFEPLAQDKLFSPDMLGDGTVARLMERLIDHRAKRAVGLAFDPDASARPEVGFEFALRRGVDSIGYRTDAWGGWRYTVLNLYLDVTPVKMAEPLYTPLAPR